MERHFLHGSSKIGLQLVISGNMLKAKAVDLNLSMNINSDIKTSSVCLQKFTGCHEVSERTISGKSIAVDGIMVQQWIDKVLLCILSDYQLKTFTTLIRALPRKH